MDNFVGYADRPFAFIGRYLKERWRSHTVIVTFIALAVMCSVGTQYAVKFLVDSLTTGIPQKVWLTFSLLVSLNRRRQSAVARSRMGGEYNFR